MRFLLTLLAVSTASIASAACDEHFFQVTGANATAYDSKGTALFRGDQEFLIEYVGTQGQVYEIKGNRARISQDGKDQVWLRCSELEPLTGCSKATSMRGDDTRGAGVPNCPGDPRCPRRD